MWLIFHPPCASVEVQFVLARRQRCAHHAFAEIGGAQLDEAIGEAAQVMAAPHGYARGVGEGAVEAAAAGKSFVTGDQRLLAQVGQREAPGRG